MTGDPYTARANSRHAVKEAIAEVNLKTNEYGQYTYDAIQSLISQVKETLRGAIPHAITKGEGMLPLTENTNNELTKIKATDYADPEELLTKSKADTAKKTVQTNMPETPTLQSITEAIELANHKNYNIQATIGTKVGAAEGIAAKVGAAITDAILKRTDSDGMKGPDEYTLHEVLEAAIAGAIRPAVNDILTQLIDTINFTFDFRKTIAANMEKLHAKANASKPMASPSTRATNLSLLSPSPTST